MPDTQKTEAGSAALQAGQVPRLKSNIHILPFKDGSNDSERFLVEVGEVCFVANSAMRDVLVALGEEPQTLEELAAVYERQTGQPVTTEVLSELLNSRIPQSLFLHTPDPKSEVPFVVSRRLIPARYVLPLTSRLKWMFSTPLVIAVLCAFAVVEYFVFTRSIVAIHDTYHAGELFIYYLAIIGGTLFHELGHATACQRYDCPHGDIGVGIYFLYPAFYTDVTKAWRLTPRQRAVIDIGGVYFQCFLIVALAVHVFLTHNALSLRLIWVTQLTMVFTLNPIFKMDGYWLLSDLGGLPNLHKQMAATLKRVVKKLLRQPFDQAWLITGRRLKMLYLYIGLVFLYIGYIGHFLYESITYTAQYYPWQVGRTLHFIQGAYQHSDQRAVTFGIGHLLYISIWPLLLSFIAFFFMRRLVRMLPWSLIFGKIFGAKQELSAEAK